jgi:hypothetical protein
LAPLSADNTPLHFPLDVYKDVEYVPQLATNLPELAAWVTDAVISGNPDMQNVD